VGPLAAADADKATAKPMPVIRGHHASRPAPERAKERAGTKVAMIRAANPIPLMTK
jgi:hypothetical protein